ncbi:MAG: nicotinate-nucleotide pyrophosphorylase [Gracilibacter sp. BRH_c7a]|nr:MAG: nicotinate-nucleotide pyrophosphorylase [Gracilibacter sp. BRH_c7a]
MSAMFQYNELIERALKEDIGTGDLSTMIIPDDHLGEAKIYAKEHGIVCGGYIAEMVFQKVDSRIRTETYAKDGDRISPGSLVMKVIGPLAGILQAERTAINFMQHLSGIASMTRRLVDIVSDLGVKIVDTRKTMPGMRSLQKYAVRIGGGNNHRFGLYDAVMLKDNHHAVVGGLDEAIRRVKEKVGHMVKIEVECETLDQVQDALDYGVDVIMLDNMSLEDMKAAVKLINKKAIIEASGGITEENIRKVAETGVDILSVGRLTHSVMAIDFSMVVDEMKPSMQKHITLTEKI